MAPKRPADSYTAPSPASAAASAGGKRVKFAPGEASAAGGTATGADEFEDDLETGGGAGKNKVVTDGYDSDSSAGSDDGFGVGGGRKGRKDATGGGADDAEDDDDMFGDGDASKDAGAADKSKGKKKEFLEMGDIEGQEFGKGDDDEGGEEELDDEEDYEFEDDLANDDDAPRSRRSKKTMGYQLSSFNMQDELAEGRFAADGSYVQNSGDPLATHDSWLDGMSKKAIKAARDSKKRMDEEAKRREEDDSKGEGVIAQERDDCLIGLLSLVREGETVTRALARLGAARKKVVKKKVKAKPSTTGDEMELDGDIPVEETPAAEETAPEEDPADKKINRITLLASTLLSQGELEIYDQSYEDIIKTLKTEGAVRRDWIPPRDPDIEREAEAAAAQATANSATSGRRVLIARPTTAAAPASSATDSGSKFSYKWIKPQEGQPPGQEYGPFPRAELEGWIAGGYFGAGGEGITVKVNGKDSWETWAAASASVA